jgi:hypothetical protein
MLGGAGAGQQKPPIKDNSSNPGYSFSKSASQNSKKAENDPNYYDREYRKMKQAQSGDSTHTASNPEAQSEEEQYDEEYAAATDAKSAEQGADMQDKNMNPVEGSDEYYDQEYANLKKGDATESDAIPTGEEVDYDLEYGAATGRTPQASELGSIEKDATIEDADAQEEADKEITELTPEEIEALLSESEEDDLSIDPEVLKALTSGVMDKFLETASKLSPEEIADIKSKSKIALDNLMEKK